MTVNRIKKLDKVTINRIAAGEIIHRPFNAIKELLENSLDAKSTQIQILVKDGGLKLLQITDNGTGILKDDLEIVCERFTTSKLTQIEDLNSIATFGFRGEALASITHVAHLTLTSRTANSQCAWRAYYSDGKLVAKKGTAEPKPCAGNIGTQITVEDLFYNIPTRKKAFKNTTEEYNKIVEVVSKYAIHNSGVAFSVKKQGSSSADLQTNTHASKIENIKSIYGSALGKELKEFSSNSDEYEFKLTGYISNANYNCKKKELILFINNRLIESSSIKKGLDSVYSKYLSKGGNWFAYISLFIRPENIDVNVHPTKKEVRFLHEDTIIELILRDLDSKLENIGESRNFYIQKSIDDEFKLTSLSQETPKRLSDSQKTPAYKLVRTDVKTRTLDSFVQQSGSPVLKRTRIADPDTTFLHNEPPSNEMDVSDLIDIEFTQRDTPPTPQNILPPALSTPKKVVNVSNIHPVVQKSPQASSQKRKLTLFGQIDHTLDQEDTENAILSNDKLELDEIDVSQQPHLESLISVHEDSNDTIANNKEWIKVHLASIQTLKEELVSQHNEQLTEVFQDYQFVGCINSQLALIQYQTNLLMVNYHKISRDFFYQVAIYGFSNFGKIVFSSSYSILDNLSGSHNEKFEAVNMLIEKADMLQEYFSIVINSSGLLVAIPVLLSGYVPNLSKLPEFLDRLVKVDYETEIGCFRDMANTLAWFYQVESNSKVVEHVIFPGFRHIIGQNKWTDEKSIVQLANLADLYKIFERC
ncbi:DNA mismatch repair protein [Boothiomyces sp. JEL0866]|nr:DNA mismatch repair protein [Boothiomyces sp. JEL0866]